MVELVCMNKNINIERLLQIAAIIYLAYIVIDNGSPIFERLFNTVFFGLLFIIASIFLIEIPNTINTIKQEKSKRNIILEIFHVVVFAFYEVSYVYLFIKSL